eukprot:171179-Rhodomonas_salina.1
MSAAARFVPHSRFHTPTLFTLASRSRRIASQHPRSTLDTVISRVVHETRELASEYQTNTCPGGNHARARTHTTAAAANIASAKHNASCELNTPFKVVDQTFGPRKTARHCASRDVLHNPTSPTHALNASEQDITCGISFWSWDSISEIILGLPQPN